MEEKNDGFFMYRSYFEAIETAEDDLTKLELYNAIMHYGMNGTEPKLTGLAKGMFLTWRVNIDNGHARRVASIENGNKGGRPKKVEDKLKNNPKKPNNNLSQNTNNQSKPKVNLEIPEPNLNNNINTEIENNVEESFNSLDNVSGQIFISNIISDDPVEGVIEMNDIFELDKEFRFIERYEKHIEDKPSISFEKTIFNLIYDYDKIFNSIKTYNYSFDYSFGKDPYQSIIEKDIDPINIFYQLVKIYQRY